MRKAMELKPDTFKQQELLAEYCRSGSISDDLEVNTQNVIQYRRLVRNIIYDTLSSAYPITKSYLSNEDWSGLVDEFFKNYTNTEAQIWKMPFGLCDYISNYPNSFQDRFPFFDELLYFEWLEIELYAEKDIAHPTYRSELNKVNLNPHHRIIELSHPYHKFPIEKAIKLEGASFLVLFRDLSSFKVKFSEISPLIAEILKSLNEHDCDLISCVTHHAAAFDLYDTEIIFQQATKILDDFKHQGLFI